MDTGFTLNHETLAAEPRFVALAWALSAQSRIDSRASFNFYCREAFRLWKAHFGSGIGKTSATFADLCRQIECRDAGTIPTPWGGVVVTVHDPPRVEKYLVVRQGNFLALEKHAEKDERLDVQEGAGLILFRHAAADPLTVQALAPGDRFHFAPGMEHCLIGTEDLLVFERSLDPKGMDQDLIFLYEPEEPSSLLADP